MKFHEHLAAARAQARQAPAAGSGPNLISLGVEPVFKPILANRDGGVPVETSCQVCVTGGIFRDVNVSDIPAGTETYSGSIRSATIYPIALPRGMDVNAPIVLYAAKINGQYWAVAPVSTTCTTTSTTTRPPCACTGSHPDMRVTISGVAAGPRSTCIASDGTDLYCRNWNRTWCLYNIGGCVWASDFVPKRCALPGERQIVLYYPWAYVPGCGYTPADCKSAFMELVGANVNYESCDFDPDTGGTFTLLTDRTPTNDCQSFPSTLTVTVSASCTTTTTTTTTSTTSTSTTSTTSTTTSTTTTGTVGTCNWQWDNTLLIWVKVFDGCLMGQACSQPIYSGTFDGEPATTNCV